MMLEYDVLKVEEWHAPRWVVRQGNNYVCIFTTKTAASAVCKEFNKLVACVNYLEGVIND